MNHINYKFAFYASRYRTDKPSLKVYRMFKNNYGTVDISDWFRFINHNKCMMDIV